MDLSKLEGLITEEKGEALSRLAGEVPKELAIVEIGSYKGKSTCYLAQGAKQGGGAHVYAIDPWDTEGNETGRFGFAEPETFEAFEEQVKRARLKSRVTPIKGFSVNVAEDWDEQGGPDIGLLFIDGDHHREPVVADFNAFRHFLVPGKSLVVFDDYDDANHEVIEAVDEDLIKYLSHSKVEAPGLFRARYEGEPSS